jgi:hypothetical protein
MSRQHQPFTAGIVLLMGACTLLLGGCNRTPEPEASPSAAAISPEVQAQKNAAQQADAARRAARSGSMPKP